MTFAAHLVTYNRRATMFKVRAQDAHMYRVVVFSLSSVLFSAPPCSPPPLYLPLPISALLTAPPSSHLWRHAFLPGLGPFTTFPQASLCKSLQIISTLRAPRLLHWLTLFVHLLPLF